MDTRQAIMLQVLLFCVIGSSLAAKYPPDLPRCHYGDSGCLAKVIPMYAKGLKSGRRDLNFVPLDPLQVNEVDIVQGAQSPVNINLKFRDMQCYGLSMVQIKDIEGFDRDPETSKFGLTAQLERISLVGQYKARGNILLLPIYGNGRANLTFDKVEAKVKLVTEVIARKGKKYLQIMDVVLDFSATRLWMNFENLFNGDKALSDSTNAFLNENWLDILNELKPVLTRTIGEIYRAIITPIFAKFPYDELFLRDE